ncbi:hypothetical protein [Caryophanon tenue]|uniref:DUF948 domain-containing protein n=1 Tax=Caryophanon tenue TaxID=33978 RepID=A0A1C0YE34_9BACL|nr:hypothetical protein [Caryophanon tenue]OCS85373.1 hypothetical protein A6M13_13105 [Caryophanon tenue]
MHIMYIISLALVGIGILVFLGSAIVAAVGAKEPGQYIFGRVKKMQADAMPIVTEVTKLQNNIQQVQTTVNYQKQQLQAVPQAFAGVKAQVEQLNLTAKRKAHQTITKAENDPVVQQNVEQYTEKAMDMLHRS